MYKKPLLLGILALIASWWAYAPGLAGTFLFDDFNNLDKLGAYGGVHDLRSLLFYLTSGNADPTGRPLSLLSFLIDAQDWPAAPFPFKRTNLLLHMLNGLLLAATLIRLGLQLGLERRHAARAAMVGASLWLLHPFLVSTTLYVVQREAMLPATFTLCGALLWLAGRERLRRGRRGGIALLLGGSWGCMVLASLCKANGILLPLLLLTMEWTVLRAGDAAAPAAEAAPALRRARCWLLGLPSIALGCWLLSKVPTAFSGETYGRPWTVGQRLLTEPRALCDYLSALWLPRADSASLFNDGYPASTDLLHPATTLPALLAVTLLIAAGFRYARRWPALAFAILFFFAGQLLESSVVPLELYFEHRNYLPALPMFWPLGIWLTGDAGLPRLRATLAVLLPLLLAVLCHARVEVWGEPYQQALLLAQVNPQSPRAQANAASYERAFGHADLAIRRLAMAAKAMPDQVQLTLNWVDAECANGRVTPAALDAALYSIRHNHNHVEFVQNWLNTAIDDAAARPCAGLDLNMLETMIEAVRNNPDYGDGPGRIAEVSKLEGRLALARGDGDAALRQFDQGLSAYPTPDGALTRAAQLGAAGFPRLGLMLLAHYRTLPPVDRHLHGMAAVNLWLLGRYGYWDQEFAALEASLRSDDTTSPAQGR